MFRYIQIFSVYLPKRRREHISRAGFRNFSLHELSMYESLDIKPKGGAYAADVLSVQLLEDCRLPSIIETSEGDQLG